MSQTPRIGINYLRAAQTQKEITVNEALRIVDLALAPAVDGMLVDTPPPSPASGACYIIGPSPAGAFVGHAQALAGYGDGGWRFIAASEGLTAFDKGSGQFATFAAGSWQLGRIKGAALLIDGEQVVGPRLAAIAGPAGGTTVDEQARSAIGAILSALRQHGLIDS